MKMEVDRKYDDTPDLSKAALSHIPLKSLSEQTEGCVWLGFGEVNANIHFKPFAFTGGPFQ